MHNVDLRQPLPTVSFEVNRQSIPVITRLEINHLKHERQQQRLDVSKMKSTARRSGPLVESQQDVSLANELEANRVQIAELRGEIELQASVIFHHVHLVEDTRSPINDPSDQMNAPSFWVHWRLL